ncbi:hypothetical protein [Bacillus bombysepticus]|uniref:hypothetical protein n=1 Tax=Bacillus bombysepticus TaxID=658666 RepID=UPI003019A7A3
MKKIIEEVEGDCLLKHMEGIKGRYQIKEKSLFGNGLLMILMILLPILFFATDLLLYIIKPKGTYHDWVLEFPIWYYLVLFIGYMDYTVQDSRVYRVIWVGLVAWLVGNELFLGSFTAGVICGFIFAVVAMIKPLWFKRTFVPLFIVYMWVGHLFIGLTFEGVKWYKILFPEFIENTVGGWMIVLPLVLAIISTKMFYIEEDIVIDKDYDRTYFIRESLGMNEPKTKTHHDEDSKI